ELHVFPFSRRTGTPAARMEGQIDDDTKNERVRQMIALSDQMAKEYASNYDNEVLEVIPEEHAENNANMLIGYTDNYLKVQFEGAPDLIGKIVRVKITKAGYPINDGIFVRVMKDASHQNIQTELQHTS